MKEYLCVRIDLPKAMLETAIGYLSMFPFDGITEESNHLLAYIPVEVLTDGMKNEIESLITQIVGNCTWTKVENINWNKAWEESFHPIIVEDLCYVRAQFHPRNTKDMREIVIDPRMAFGTGHHATTYLVLKHVFQNNFAGKTVLDYGCGTGILSIGVYIRGGRRIDCIDIDSNSIENTKLNLELNNASVSFLGQGDLDILEETSYDYILANINKHVICNNINSLYRLINPSGIVVLSGILAEHKHSMRSVIEEASFSINHIDEKDGWLMYVCTK